MRFREVLPVLCRMKIAIAHPDPKFRERFNPIISVSNGAELLCTLSSIVPDVVILAKDMPVMDGPRTAGYLKDLFPEVLVIKEKEVALLRCAPLLV